MDFEEVVVSVQAQICVLKYSTASSFFHEWMQQLCSDKRILTVWQIRQSVFGKSVFLHENVHTAADVERLEPQPKNRGLIQFEINYRMAINDHYLESWCCIHLGVQNTSLLRTWYTTNSVASRNQLAFKKSITFVLACKNKSLSLEIHISGFASPQPKHALSG
jgi:hypothetical protein